ncbi:aspartate--tRNA(Asn) ligase [Candidatus Woesearchaeota archaeon]|nr:aspartate--tRNA(Asn) ligase [Candidatus Woesearchaeota archaeon]
MQRTHINQIQEGHTVNVQGWVHSLRGQSKIKFLQLRDITGVVQCILMDQAQFPTFDKLLAESAISITGLVKKAVVKSEEVTQKTVEIEIQKLDILNVAEPLPITISTTGDALTNELSKRLDYRYVDLHRRDTQAIFKIQSTLLAAFREFMVNEGATECIFPSIIGASSEGGTELYPVQYFEKTAVLSQSCQLYKQMAACSLEKVFSVFTVWRAEKHNTLRHLNEARQMDFEVAFADDKVAMDVLGRCVQYIVKTILERNATDLEVLKVLPKIPTVKYMTFAEVATLMKQHHVEMGEDDLSGESEQKLGELYPDTVIFVHDWPLAGKPFYIMPKGEHLSYGYDAIYQGMEICSGGQRIHLPELLIERLKVKGLNPDHFKSYIDSFRYGAPPHAGWGVGVERLTMQILGIKNIREVTLFPRDRDRLTP